MAFRATLRTPKSNGFTKNCLSKFSQATVMKQRCQAKPSEAKVLLQKGSQTTFSRKLLKRGFQTRLSLQGWSSSDSQAAFVPNTDMALVSNCFHKQVCPSGVSK
jgi:hypothetical protein